MPNGLMRRLADKLALARATRPSADMVYYGRQ